MSGEALLWQYNCLDCCNTFEIDEKEQLNVDSMGLREQHDFQQSLFHPVLASMIAGVRMADRGPICQMLLKEIAEREAWITEAVGRPLNPKSPKQMTEFFYDELAQKEIKSRKTNSRTCDDDALSKIAAREPLLLPLVQRIGELRSLGVFLSTFAEAPTDSDGRMRCSFNIAGTETYRFSSSENAFNSGMNMQNISSGDEGSEALGLILPNMRKPFLPDPGMTFFDIDLDSSDLRIVTWESDCRGMKELFSAGLKPYVEVAKEFYHDPTITKFHPSYPRFKAICHALNYLGTPNGIAGKVGFTVNEVDRISRWYFGKFPEILTWQNRVKSQVNSRKFVENVFGYRWHILDRIDGNIYNRAVAWIGQSTTACVINRGYRNLYEQVPDIQVLLQVHDSLAGQFPTHMGDEAIRRIVSACSISLPFESGEHIIPVGVKSSNVSWGDCK